MNMWGLKIDEIRKIDQEECDIPHEYLTPEEADKVLNESKIQGGQIWYKEQWMRICRVDLFHQVPTICTHFKCDCGMGQATYGARILEGDFMIIDCLTDG